VRLLEVADAHSPRSNALKTQPAYNGLRIESHSAGTSTGRGHRRGANDGHHLPSGRPAGHVEQRGVETGVGLGVAQLDVRRSGPGAVRLGPVPVLMDTCAGRSQGPSLTLLGR